MPAWKRWLAATCFMGGGGAAAAWGFHDLLAWIDAFHAGAEVIETENIMFAFPLMGLSIFAIGPEFILPGLVASWSDRVQTRVATGVLGAMLAGIVLLFLGQLALNVIMEADGYHACDVQGRGRFTAVTWARADTACVGRAR